MIEYKAGMTKEQFVIDALRKIADDIESGKVLAIHADFSNEIKALLPKPGDEYAEYTRGDKWTFAVTWKEAKDGS